MWRIYVCVFLFLCKCVFYGGFFIFGTPPPPPPPPFLVNAEFATTKTYKNACSCSERNIHRTITKSNGEGEWLEGLALKYEMKKSNITIPSQMEGVNDWRVQFEVWSEQE